MRLESHLRARRDEGRKLLVPYVTGGLGSQWLDVVRAVIDSGADAVVACVGGGSNAIGTFAGFVDLPHVRLIGVEAGGHGIETGQHGASVDRGVPGVLHGSRSLFLQDEDGQILEPHSISAGLDYPGVGPEHAQLAAAGRAEYGSATDDEALAGFQLLAATEGIVPALEPAHAIGWLAREAGHAVPTGSTVLVTLSGRGDKDAAQVAERLGSLE